MTSEFYANGHDAGYYGDDAHSHGYAPGTAAYNDWYAGYEDGAQAYQVEYEAQDAADDREDDDGLTDAEADAMTLAGAGWGTDEDYGYYGDDFGGDY